MVTNARRLSNQFKKDLGKCENYFVDGANIHYNIYVGTCDITPKTGCNRRGVMSWARLGRARQCLPSGSSRGCTTFNSLVSEWYHFAPWPNGLRTLWKGNSALALRRAAAIGYPWGPSKTQVSILQV